MMAGSDLHCTCTYVFLLKKILVYNTVLYDTFYMRLVPATYDRLLTGVKIQINQN